MINPVTLFGGGFVAITMMSLPVVGVTALPTIAGILGFIGTKLWGTGHKL